MEALVLIRQCLAKLWSVCLVKAVLYHFDRADHRSEDRLKSSSGLVRRESQYSVGRKCVRCGEDGDIYAGHRGDIDTDGKTSTPLAAPPLLRQAVAAVGPVSGSQPSAALASLAPPALPLSLGEAWPRGAGPSQAAICPNMPNPPTPCMVPACTDSNDQLQTCQDKTGQVKDN
ncbi:hypothetical protein DPEC_G00149340 [Dallia pectoralis]|uniref:Uncharacterized protein n=1 Tax=Dallia pectoralis TaxID=75939 RepID=A0ACC2GJ99_DALPE|nr:hypothetical protein DPEC_G00149340 [Dallia pectoralis]